MSGVIIMADLNRLVDIVEEKQSWKQLAFKLYNAGVLYDDDDVSSTFAIHAQASKSRESQLFTEYVPVPIYEHVAEIVDRHGCKIKGLYAETGTYIKTPTPGEEPVFIISSKD